MVMADCRRYLPRLIDSVSVHREIEKELRSLAGTDHIDETAVVMHRIPHYCQAKAGTAAAHHFFTVERAENSRYVLFRNAGAVVFDRYHHILARFYGFISMVWTVEPHIF